MKLAGRRALVTGGVRRLGRAIALALAAEGADVVVTSRSVGCAAEDVVTELLRAGAARARVVAMDVRDPAAVTHGVAAAAEYMGGIDVLVNNAGAYEAVSLEKISIEQWDAVMETNLRGPFLVSQAALPHLRERGGRIVNLGSLGGDKPWVTHGHYCASKAGLHMLTETMAKAWAPAVSVNCVAPGMISFGDVSTLAEKTPMGRDGSASDVASAVVFFAAGPGFVTGQVLRVDGGLGL